LKLTAIAELDDLARIVMLLDRKLEISKIHFTSDLSGFSTSTIYIANHHDNDVILKLRCNEPKRYHISRSEFSPNDDIFFLNKRSTISINISVNLSRVVPNEKDRTNGFINDRFQILYKEIPTLDASQLANLKELWEGIRKTGKPLEVIANCTVELPSRIDQNNAQSTSIQPLIINPTQPINSNSTLPLINSTNSTIPIIQPIPLSTIAEGSPQISTKKSEDKSIPEIPPLLLKTQQPITNISSQSISMKSKQATKSKTLTKPASPFQKFKQSFPLFVQEFQISDYEDVRLLSWRGFLVIFIAFLIGKLIG
jgi:hypothetical protein